MSKNIGRVVGREKGFLLKHPKWQKEAEALGLLPLKPDKEFKVYQCTECPGKLHAIGYGGLAVICKCDHCGERFRR